MVTVEEQRLEDEKWRNQDARGPNGRRSDDGAGVRYCGSTYGQVPLSSYASTTRPIATTYAAVRKFGRSFSS